MVFINTNSCIIISWWCWWTPNYYNYHYLSFKSHSISNYNYYYYHQYLILIILNPSHSLTFTLSNISNLSIIIIPFLFLYHLWSLYIQNWGKQHLVVLTRNATFYIFYYLYNYHYIHHPISISFLFFNHIIKLWEGRSCNMRYSQRITHQILKSKSHNPTIFKWTVICAINSKLQNGFFV